MDLSRGHDLASYCTVLYSEYLLGFVFASCRRLNSQYCTVVYSTGALYLVAVQQSCYLLAFGLALLTLTITTTTTTIKTGDKVREAAGPVDIYSVSAPTKGGFVYPFPSFANRRRIKPEFEDEREMTDRGSNDDLRGPGMLQGRYDNISRNNYDGKLTRSATRNSSSSSLTNRITRRTPVARCASSSYGVIMVIAVALRTSVLLLVTAVLATAASDTEFTPFTPLTSTNKDGQKLVSIPLIPHHVQKARRGLSSGQTSSSMLDEAPRRRQEAQQVGALYHGVRI